MQNLTLLLGVGLLISLLLLKLQTVIRSPLRKIPNAHFTAPFTRLWLIWIRGRGREVTTTYEAHKRLGPIVRTGPTEISINCVEDGVQPVFGSWNKAPLYANFVNYGHPPLFSILQSKPHAERKKLYSHIYSKSTIENSNDLRKILLSSSQHFGQMLDTWSETAAEVNILPISEAYCMDIVTNYIYGISKGTDWLTNQAKANHYLPAFQIMLEPWPFFVFTELTSLMGLLSKIGINLLPSKVFSSLSIVHPFVHNLTKTALDELPAIKQKTEWSPLSETKSQGMMNTITTTDSSQLSSSSCASLVTPLQHVRDKAIEAGIPQQMIPDLIASDILDQIHAGHEATGIILTYTMYALSQPENQRMQTRLRHTLQQQRQEAADFKTNTNPQIQSDLLDAILTETMRLHPAAMGPFPRITPEKGAHIAGHFLPGGTLVTASPYSLGRHESIFENAEDWRPERWLGNLKADTKRKMKKWVWTFGSGARLCIGEHLALLAMKSFLVDVYSRFRTSIASESDMRQMESFIALPKGESLYLRFERA